MLIYGVLYILAGALLVEYAQKLAEIDCRSGDWVRKKFSRFDVHLFGPRNRPWEQRIRRSYVTIRIAGGFLLLLGIVAIGVELLVFRKPVR